MDSRDIFAVKALSNVQYTRGKKKTADLETGERIRDDFSKSVRQHS